MGMDIHAYDGRGYKGMSIGHMVALVYGVGLTRILNHMNATGWEGMGPS
jgi:hypothetical protein